MTVFARSKTTPMQIVTQVIGAGVAMLGLLVMVGWFRHDFRILQVNAAYIPMQFNTALSFFTAGIGLCLAATGKRSGAALFGSVTGVFGLLTMIEYVFGVSLGIDQLLMQTYIMTTVKYPGRMAPLASLCFLLGSLALWAAWRATTTGKWSVIGILGSLIAALGAIGLLGYLTELSTTYVWGNFSSMAIHTAIGFIALGLGLVAHTFQSEQHYQIQKSVWRAGAIAVGTLTVFAGASQTMLANEENSIQSKAEFVARAEATQIKTTLELHLQAIERMAERAEVRLPDESEWVADATHYVQHGHGTYDAIAWISPSHRIRWEVSPLAEKGEALSSEEIIILTEAAERHRQVHLMRFVSAADGNTKFIILAPIYRQATLEGCIVAIVNPAKLFENIKMITDNPYGFSIHSGSETLFTSDPQAGKRMTSWIRSVKGSLDDVEWEMHVWPVDRMHSPAPWFVLLAGLLSASTLTILVLKSHTVNARSRELLNIIDTAPIGMLVLDADGCLRQMNKEGEKLLAFTLDEIIGQQVHTFLPGIMQLDQTSPSKSYIALPAKCRRKDGTELFVEVGINRVLIDDKEHILVVVIDVSQRRYAEEALKTKSTDLMRTNNELGQLQQLLQTTIDHMPALVGSWDIHFCNRFGNQAYIDWFGVSPEQMRGKHMTEIIGKERFEILKPQLLSVLQGNTEVFERTVILPSGEIRHAVFSYVPDMEDGVVKGYYGFVSDVTLLKQTQIAKENVLRQLQDIIDAAKDFAIVETDKHGIITLFSRGAELLLGYSAQEMVGTAHVGQFHLTDEVDACAEKISHQLGRKVEGSHVAVELANIGSNSHDWTYVHKDGSTLLVNLTVAAIRDQQDNITGYLGIAKDIRKEQEILQALADARDKAQAANLAKSQFLANMSHEIRTPMNAILGMLQLLQNTELTARQLDYAFKTQSAARALLSLLNDILDFSKVEADKMELEHAPFHIDALMRDLSVIFSSNVGNKELDILFSIAPNSPAQVLGDEMRLRQVLINLVGNAIKFTERGEIMLSLEIVEQKLTHTTLRFSVQDSGIGIGPEQLTYVFEGFSQAEASTTRRFGGTGLGLSISQRLVSLMGGKLEVASTLGVGSCFHFTLTMEHAAGKMAVAADTSAPLTAHPHNAAYRVLIVDDNPNARTILLTMAASLGWQAEVADGVQTALTTLATSPSHQTPYYALFIDSNMPDMDGLSSLIALKQMQQKDIVVIVMATAHERELLVKQGKPEQHAIDGFLIKPVTASMLQDALATATRPLVNVMAKPRKMRLVGLRLLVVEDTIINQQVVFEFLTGEGAYVEVANDGRAGLECALASDPLFDAILIDIQMPIMDGYEATQKLRQDPRMQLIPIIAITANAMERDKELCRAAGMNDHVAKPIELDDLVRTILRYCKVDSLHAESIHAEAEMTLENASDSVIEFDSALKRLGGNRNLFTRLAARFTADSVVMIADFKNYLNTGDFIHAAMAMHTLKGIASTIGAAALAGYADQVELQLKKAHAQNDARFMIAGLEAHASEAQNALDGIRLDLMEVSEPFTESEPAIKTMDAIFDALDTLLKASNMEAINVFLELQEKLGDKQKEKLLPLANAINSLDFRRSLQCSQLLRTEVMGA